MEQDAVLPWQLAAGVRGEALPGHDEVAAEFLPVLAAVEEALQQLLAGGVTSQRAILVDQVFRSMSRLYRRAATTGMSGVCDLAYETAQAFGTLSAAETVASHRLTRLALVAVEQMQHLLTPDSRERSSRRARQTVLSLLSVW
ncbi:MAG: hypothetical protein HQL88_08745 [Magnetococcales bacterium]|nr:hypothetical protein [Magnetococcales bacterium]